MLETAEYRAKALQPLASTLLPTGQACAEGHANLRRLRSSQDPQAEQPPRNVW